MAKTRRNRKKEEEEEEEPKSEEGENSKLRIIPIQPEEQEGDVKKVLHPNLPDIYKGQLLCLVAPIRAGKGVLWNNLLLNENMFLDLFKDTHIISNSISSDSSSRFSYQKFRHNCHEIYSDKIIKDIIKHQKAKLANEDADTSFCLVLDDLLGQFPKNGRKGMAAINFSSRFRHQVRKPDPVMLIYSTQRYYDLNKVVRNCATGLFFSGMIKSTKEWEQIVDDYGDTFGGHAKFNEMIKEVQKEPYQWLYLKMDCSPPQAFKNFTTKLF